MLQDVTAPKPSVLLVEDDPDQSALFVRALRQKHLAVTACATGHEGSQLAERPDYSVVLSDMMLPDVCGLEIVGRSKRLHPWRPTLLLTAHGGEASTRAALRSQVDDVLTKPFSLEHLATRVSRLADASHAARAARGRTVVAIGAHPDDVELGCGAILARHRRVGDRIVVVTLTSGAKGGEAPVRAAESRRAAAMLGAELVLEDLPDTELGRSPALIPRIAAVIDAIAPTIVYTHTLADTHQDHRAVHSATLVAARAVPNVFCYESPSTTRAFSPSLFIDVGAHLDDKAAMLACYEGQRHRPYFEGGYVRAAARYWGRFAAYRLVEPLEVVRAVG